MLNTKSVSKTCDHCEHYDVHYKRVNFLQVTLKILKMLCFNHLQHMDLQALVLKHNTVKI